MTEEEYREQEESNWELILAAILAFYGLSEGIIRDVGDDIRVWYSKYGTNGVVRYLESRKLIPKLKVSKRNHLIRKLNKRIDKYVDAQQKAFEDLIRTLVPDFPKDEILKYDWATDGKTFLDRLEDDRRTLRVFVEQTLDTNLIKGGSADDVIKAVEKKFKTMDKRVATRFKTEAVARVSEMQKKQLKQDGVKKYQYRAVMDTRTSEICIAMNGRIFYVSEYKVGINAPPLHPNCRSYTTPYDGKKQVGEKA